MGIVQIPSSWKSRIVDGVLLDVLFKLYSLMRPPHSKRIMESISMLSSVRSSLFDSMSVRTNYLSKLISGICSLIENKIGMFFFYSFLPFFFFDLLPFNYQIYVI